MAAGSIDTWRTNFQTRLGVPTPCAEESCNNHFIKRSQHHMYCDTCRAERKRQADRNYDESRRSARSEARRKARMSDA